MEDMIGRLLVQTSLRLKLKKTMLLGNAIMMLSDIPDKSAQLSQFFSFTRTGERPISTIRWLNNLPRET